jgi:hypothetical protein
VRGSLLRSGEPNAIVLAPSAHRLYKKFAPALQERVKEEAQKISRAPHAAPPLHAPFEGTRSHHFQFRNADHRIAYRIREDKRQPDSAFRSPHSSKSKAGPPMGTPAFLRQTGCLRWRGRDPRLSVRVSRRVWRFRNAPSAFQGPKNANALPHPCTGRRYGGIRTRGVGMLHPPPADPAAQSVR